MNEYPTANVSAVILTRDRLPLLKRAVRSVLGQTMVPAEIIIVDNGSSDGTREWCESLEGVRYIHLPGPTGESTMANHARNVGIRAATSEYVAFLDDDDCWLPRKIEAQMSFVKKTGARAVFCGRRVETLEPEGTRFSEIPADPTLTGDVSRKCMYRVICLTSELLAEKSLLEEAGLFDERLNFWQEIELTMRLAQLTPFYAVTAPMIMYRVDKTDRVQRSNIFRGWIRDVRYIYKKHRALVKRLSLREKLLVWRQVASDALRRRRHGRVARRYRQAG